MLNYFKKAILTVIFLNISFTTYCQLLEQMEMIDKKTLSGEYNEAKSLCDSLISIYRDSSILYTTRGNIYIYLYELELAERDFKKAIKLTPSNNLALTYLGELDFINSKYKQGLEKLYKLIQYDSLNHYGYTHIGLIYIQLNEYDSAYHYLTKAIKLDSLKSMYWYNRGFYHVEVKKPLEAVNDFKKGLKSDSNVYFKSLIFQSYIDLLIEQDLLDSAENIIVLANANGFMFYDNSAVINYKKEKYLESINFANLSLESYPNSINMWELKGDAYERLLLKKESCECFKTALEYSIKWPNKLKKRVLNRKIKEKCK